MIFEKEKFKQEVHLKEGEYCILFDFACYFPYSNPEILQFNFSLGIKEFNDLKINARYPNKNLRTISKKYGKKVSKIGYPYIDKILEINYMLLKIDIGIKEDHFSLVFPMIVEFTKENNIAYLNFKFNFDTQEFYFETYGDGKRITWGNYEPNYTPDIRIFSKPVKSGYTTLIYEEIITPIPFSLYKEDFLI